MRTLPALRIAFILLHAGNTLLETVVRELFLGGKWPLEGPILFQEDLFFPQTRDPLPAPNDSQQSCGLAIMNITTVYTTSKEMGYDDVGGICEISLEYWANWSLGVLMYVRKAALLHLPKSCITESSTPAWAAAVAAPIRKL